MLTIVWGMLSSRLGGWIVGGLAVAAVLVVLKLEHNARLKAQAGQVAAVQALTVGYEGYVKLYQEREKIQATAANERRKVNELRQKLDYYGISDSFNNPDGVQPVPKPANGGAKTPTRFRTPGGAPTTYRTAP